MSVFVEQGLVAFAAAPQHIVDAAESVRDVHDLAYLAGRVGEHLRVRIGGRTPHIAAVAEQVRRAPQELEAGPFHGRSHPLGDGFEVGVAFGEGRAFGRGIAVVEAEEGYAQLVEELEGDIELQVGESHGVVAVAAEPGPVDARPAERIAAGPTEGMPITDSEAKVVFHPLAEHLTVLVVPAESQRIVRLRSFVGNLVDGGEEIAHGSSGAICIRGRSRLDERLFQQGIKGVELLPSGGIGLDEGGIGFGDVRNRRWQANVARILGSVGETGQTGGAEGRPQFATGMIGQGPVENGGQDSPPRSGSARHHR